MTKRVSNPPPPVKNKPPYQSCAAESIRYQCREIGETNWMDCDKNWFDHCQNSPLHDTRIIYEKAKHQGGAK